MGSLRGRLALLWAPAALFPSAAVAEVCDKVRPLWSPSSGPASAWDELIALSSLPITLSLSALTILALLLRWRLFAAATALLWAGLATIVAFDNFGPILDDVRYFAIKEGCIGSPHLFIALAIAICAGMIYGALRHRS